CARSVVATESYFDYW
nr:immunoglobulin heavy chain junction region [Mus musculus]MBK4184761.1 immunoglobulin heavy chain junction region [Mus musculus]MBK4184762.1 immunoglobulin heavy chain junction region [Mus musculus]MBK4184763.1 immunoglobulin heavy chain junction region [Mus musculus]MBK4184764.1 immunoglobulin heavy chain junction region [Mus musculus]